MPSASLFFSVAIDALRPIELFIIRARVCETGIKNLPVILAYRFMYIASSSR